MIMSTTILCHPPLGQSSVVPQSQNHIDFCIVLETSAALPSSTEVVIWHNGFEEGNWQDCCLSQDTNDLELDRPQGSKPHHTSFQGTLRRSSSCSSTLSFTVKYRTFPNEAWTWANDLSPVDDGEILFQVGTLPTSISDCLQGLDASIDVVSCASEATDTRLWSLISYAPPCTENEAGDLTVPLRRPLHACRFCATVRQWAAWMAPRQGQGSDLPSDEDALTASFLRSDGLHLVLLSVSGVSDVTTLLRGDGRGGVLLAARNDGPKPSEAMVLAAVGYTRESALAACIYHARRLLQPLGPTPTLTQATQPEGGDIRAAWMEGWYDGLGYSTWNALGLDLTGQKLLDALEDLQKNDIHISTLFIDDGWQSIDRQTYDHSCAWRAFEANKARFPSGLSHTVQAIRKAHPQLEHVAVWHGLLGYWNGTSPRGAIAETYPSQTCRKRAISVLPSDEVTVVRAPDAERLYADFYAFLAGAGVDSVKTDVQCLADTLLAPSERRAITSAHTTAWSRATLTHLAGRAIASMAHIPSTLFRTHLPTNRPRMLLRTWDDFFPDAPSAHGWHLFANAHNNALFARFFNIVPDWDMFQTRHEWGAYHAAARALSGGLVVFTDAPGSCDKGLLEQVVAETVQGKSIALRPSVPGAVVPSGVYVRHHDERLLRLGAYHGRTDSGTGFLGLFNVSERSLSELVLLNDIPGVLEGREYVVRRYTSGAIFGPVTLVGKVQLLPLTLPRGEWEILSAFPVTDEGTLIIPTSVSNKFPKSATLGLLDKMTGAAAVLASKSELQASKHLKISVTLKALGKLGIFFSGLEPESVADRVMVTIREQAVPWETISARSDVLEVDVERAWKEMKLVPGYNNEETVIAFINL